MPALADNNHNQATRETALEDIKRYIRYNQPDKFCQKAGNFCNSTNCGKKAEVNGLWVETKYLFNFSMLLLFMIQQIFWHGNCLNLLQQFIRMHIIYKTKKGVGTEGNS